MNTENELQNNRIEIGNNSLRNILLDGIFPNTNERSNEQKLEHIHEDMAELRKYAGELENQLVSLREIAIQTMNENNKLKKEVKDHKKETHEFLQKNGELFRFMRDKISDIRREQNQRKIK